MKHALVGLLLVVGCDAELGPSQGTVDAGNNGTVDAPTNAQVDAPVDAPACSNGRVVYLNFDGQTLTDAVTSDATLNQASWMVIGTGTAPPFRNGIGTRLADITTITNNVRNQLAEFPITVVTTRPATGPYVMIVFGGVAANVGSNYSLAVNELDCTDARKSDVAWMSDGINPPASLQQMSNVAVGAIGFGLGLTATSDPTDCMCGWANGCQSNNNVACTLSANIARDAAATQTCAGAGATQNEKQTFRTAFCQ